MSELKRILELAGVQRTQTLNEFLDGPANYSFSDYGDDVVARFKINSLVYEFRAWETFSEGEWMVAFRLDDSNLDLYQQSSKTGTGNELAVFATVLEILKELIKKKTVNTLLVYVLQSEENKVRERLYLRLMSKFGPKYGYDKIEVKPNQKFPMMKTNDLFTLIALSENRDLPI